MCGHSEVSQVSHGLLNLPGVESGEEDRTGAPERCGVRYPVFQIIRGNINNLLFFFNRWTR